MTDFSSHMTKGFTESRVSSSFDLGAPAPLENDECFFFADWLQRAGFLFTHIANENNFPVQYRVKLRRLGVDSGVPDYMVLVPRKKCMTLVFVEMKRMDKRLSKVSVKQKTWIDALELCDGVTAKVCYGAKEAMEFIMEIKKTI